MGSDTIPARVNGQIIDEQWFNLLKSVLISDQYPRNSSGIIADQAGSLGDATYAWLRAYAHHLGLVAANTRVVTVDPGAGMASNFTLTLPDALPAVRGVPVSSNAGLVTFNESDGTINLASGVIGVANASLTPAKKVAMNLSANAGIGEMARFVQSTTVTNNTTTMTDTGHRVSLVVTGRPVAILMKTDGTSFLKASFPGVNTKVSSWFDISRGVGLSPSVWTLVSRFIVELNNLPSCTNPYLVLPVSTINTIDEGLAAGTYSWKIQQAGSATSFTAEITNGTLLAYEL